MNILKTSVKPWLKKKGTCIWNSGPQVLWISYKSESINDYIRRKNPVMKCVLSRCLFSDDFVVYRSFVMLTTDFIEVLSSLSLTFCSVLPEIPCG